MPYLVEPILRANEVLAKVDDFDAPPLLDTIGGATSVLQAADALGIFAVLDDGYATTLRDFFTTLPPALDAAILAGVRSALERGVRTQISWQPGYDFELRMWERSDGPKGLLNLHIISPEPDELPLD